MYMNIDFGKGNVAGAHDVMGATGTGVIFGFSAADTSAGNNDYLTVQNPGTADSFIHILYYNPDGIVERGSGIDVPAHSRLTIAMSDPGDPNWDAYNKFPAGVVISVLSGSQVLVEKPTYSANDPTYGATDAVGFSPAGGF
jgi:hypothetical protein